MAEEKKEKKEAKGMKETMKGGVCQTCGTCACGEGCVCSCGCGWPRGHRVFRVILGLIVLCIVFFVGVKAGEIREALGWGDAGYGAYGYHMRIGGAPMMYGGYYYDAGQTQGAATATATGTVQ